MSTLLQPRDVPRVALTIDEAALALGMSRDHLERHVLPDLRVIRVGRRLLVVSPNSNGGHSGMRRPEPNCRN